jgi:histidyl-tRNA synthetase
MSSPEKPKSSKLMARTARGFQDRGPADIAGTERMLKVIRETFDLYGFEPVETPFIEYTDALGKFLPDQDRPNEGVFSFQDDDEQWLSLRYDLTAPLARHVAENFDRIPKPFRSYRSGFVFRNEKPGPGRFRQFMQFDADIVGAGSVAADAEICMLAADTMERLGIRRGQYVVKVNNRKVLDGVLEAIGLGGEENAGRRLTVLRALDKADKFPAHEIKKLLQGGRKDESGDFTKGADLSDKYADALLHLVVKNYEIDLDKEIHPDLEYILQFKKTDHEDINEESFSIKNQRYANIFGAYNLYAMGSLQSFYRSIGFDINVNELSSDGFSELRAIARSVNAAGYGSDRIRIDPSVVRGLEYYTGPVYEVELTFPVTNEDGQVVRFGSVAGGGRYDGLVGRFRPEPVPATGFSIGVSRLYDALKRINSPLVEAKADIPLVVVTTMDRDPEHMASYQALVARLRAMSAGGAPILRADLYLGSSGFNAQMKYADRRGAMVAVIQGSDERARGEVVIKDLVAGAELAAMGREGRDRDDYLARQAEAQFAVPLAEFEQAVMKVINRHR